MILLSCATQKVTSSRVHQKKSAAKLLGQWLVVSGNAIDLPEHLQALYMSSSAALSKEQQLALIELLLKYKTLFAASDTDLGHLSAVTHKIDIGTARPVRQPARRTPLGIQGEEEQHLRGNVGSKSSYTIFFRVGITNCPHKEEGWWCPLVYGLSAPKQSYTERRIPIAKNRRVS